MDDTAGVPVQFDSDDEEEKMAYELREDKSDDEDVGVEAIYEGTLRSAKGAGIEEGEAAGEVTFWQLSMYLNFFRHQRVNCIHAILTHIGSNVTFPNFSTLPKVNKRSRR